jgi:molecular chaperone Hsp33
MLNKYVSGQIKKIINKNSHLTKRKFSTDIKDYISKRDHMISGFFKDGEARFVMSDVSNTLLEAHKRFEIYDKKNLSELGIAYNTSLIMNSFLNGEERIKLLCQYVHEGSEDKSIISTIYSESMATGEVRGFFDMSKVDSTELNRDFTSFLKISKILYNHTSEVYGMIKLKNQNGFTEDDVFKYFEESEQIRTHVFFNNKVKEEGIVSQGFILQKMPNCDLIKLENRFFDIINNKIFKQINEDGLTYSQFMNVFKDLGIEVECRRTPVQFFCRCSKSGLKNVLIMMGRGEIEDMLQKEQKSVSCKNCNKEYILTDQDFKDILEKV